MAFANRSGFAPAAEPQGAQDDQLRSAAGAARQADDRRILDAFARYRARLANFIRRRVPDQGEAEDILQEVFYELVAAYRLFEPVEEASAWLFRVARNRITDFFRRKKPQPFADRAVRVSRRQRQRHGAAQAPCRASLAPAITDHSRRV
jgi:DNA-directed RNA polymerase specialized sigma24 family protein